MFQNIMLETNIIQHWAVFTEKTSWSCLCPALPSFSNLDCQLALADLRGYSLITDSWMPSALFLFKFSAHQNLLMTTERWWIAQGHDQALRDFKYLLWASQIDRSISLFFHKFCPTCKLCICSSDAENWFLQSKVLGVLR